MRRIIRPFSNHRFVVLLAAIVTLSIVTPAVRAMRPGALVGGAQVWITAVVVVLLLSGAFAVSRSRASSVTATLLAVPTVLLKLLALWDRTGWLDAAEQIASFVFLTYVAAMVLRFLFVSRHVTVDVMCAAVCVFFLMAYAWAFVYSMIAAINPDSFAMSGASEPAGEWMCFGAENSVNPVYYSLVTLTTLGYGDIVPRSPVARTLATLEAVFGQLYIAILVARLVGIHITQSTRPAERPTARPDSNRNDEQGPV